MTDTFRRGLEASQRDMLLSEDLHEELRWIGYRLSQIKPCANPVLTWGDVSPENVIVDQDDEFVGLVDFESALSAEFSLNIGYLQARFSNTTFCSALAGYWNPDVEQSVRADLYTIVRALRLMPHAGQPLPLGRSREPIHVVLPGLQGAMKNLRATL